MSVLQPWVEQLSFMQQSVLIAAVRAPDGMRKDHPVKVLMRWYRRCVLLSAFDKRALLNPYEDGGGSFTGPLDPNATGQFRGIESYVGIYLRHTDEIPHHFQLHLLHAAEIVGYKHPDEFCREFWAMFYSFACKDMHLHGETEAEMDRRLGDTRTGWLEGEVVIAKKYGDVIGSEDVKL